MNRKNLLEKYLTSGFFLKRKEIRKKRKTQPYSTTIEFHERWLQPSKMQGLFTMPSHHQQAESHNHQQIDRYSQNPQLQIK